MIRHRVRYHERSRLSGYPVSFLELNSSPKEPHLLGYTTKGGRVPVTRIVSLSATLFHLRIVYTHVHTGNRVWMEGSGLGRARRTKFLVVWSTRGRQSSNVRERPSIRVTRTRRFVDPRSRSSYRHRSVNLGLKSKREGRRVDRWAEVNRYDVLTL